MGLSHHGLRLSGCCCHSRCGTSYHQQRRQKGGSSNSDHCSEEMAPASSPPWQPTQDPSRLLLVLPIEPTCQQAATCWPASVLLLVEGASMGQMSHAGLAGSLLSPLACPAAGSPAGMQQPAGAGSCGLQQQQPSSCRRRQGTPAHPAPGMQRGTAMQPGLCRWGAGALCRCTAGSRGR